MERIEMPKLDITKYIGTKASIVYARIEESAFGKVLKLKTNPIELKDGDELPAGKYLYGSLMLGIQESDEGKLQIGIDTKADKWLRAHKIDIAALPSEISPDEDLKAFLGKEVVLQKSKTGYLEIA